MDPESFVKGQSTVIGAIILVGLTVLLAGIVFLSASTMDMPSDIGEGLPNTGRSPFSAERVGGSFIGDPVELSMYDSTSGDTVDGSPNVTVGMGPPLVDEDVGNAVSSLEGSPSLPDSPMGGEIRIDSGGYYVSSSDYVLSGWDDERVVFDTTDGPVRIGVAGDGFLSGRILAKGTTFAVEGSHPVEVYVERSDYAVDINFEDVEFDVGGTDGFRVYAQSPKGGYEADIDIEGSVFRGIVYAPGAEVEVIDSEFYGASVAEETVVDGSSYYHDTALERLGEDDLP